MINSPRPGKNHDTIRENIDVLRSMIQYLEKHAAIDTLTIT